MFVCADDGLDFCFYNCDKIIKLYRYFDSRKKDNQKVFLSYSLKAIVEGIPTHVDIFSINETINEGDQREEVRVRDKYYKQENEILNALKCIN